MIELMQLNGEPLFLDVGLRPITTIQQKAERKKGDEYDHPRHSYIHNGHDGYRVKEEAVEIRTMVEQEPPADD